MKLSKLLTIVDLHTAGEPFRIVTSGFPTIRGKTTKKKTPMQKRTLKICEEWFSNARVK
jgi:proline racemase